MRKTLLTALLMILSLATFAAKEDLYVLHADFEEGTSLPEGWTMESVFGSQNWVIEQGANLDYPQGAATGKGRIALRNNTSQTQRFVTRLITPAMDLSSLTAQPMLVFSHAQQQRLGDVDVLRIYYRTAPNSRWVQIAEYNQKIVKWQSDTIMLDAYNTKTYQIAFEGTDQFGRGIVLDDIIVRPDVTCEDARDIRARSLSGTDAVIEWGGSLDTDSFEVVVSKKLYSSVEEVDWADPAIIYHDFVYDFTVTLKDLDINTPYYIYIKAYCPTLEGQWVGGQIKTLNKVQLPFYESFDYPKQATDTLIQTENWTYGTSMKADDGITPLRTPFLCAYRTESSWHNYAFSGTAMEFGKDINAKAVPAGEYVYMASPEIDIDRIQDAYVDFWGTGYIYPHLWTSSNDVYSGYIIVGVMTNPADYATFVPVDTCYSCYYQVFDHFQVKLDKYKGNGKYVAFAASAKDWITEFWVDEVTIGSVKDPVRPANFIVKDLTPTSAVVVPEIFNATAWNVIVSDVKTEEPEKLPAKNIIVKAENIPASKADTLLTINSMEGKMAYFYVQMVQDDKKSEWSYPEMHMIPNSLASAALPKSWDFETGTYTTFDQWEYTATTSEYYKLPNGLTVYSGHYADVYIYTSTAESYAHGGNYGLHLNKRNNVTPYVVFPQLDGLQDKLFTFYYAYGTSGEDYPKAIYEVGVMTDPADTTTFELVRRFEDGAYNDWKKGEVDFFGYKGDGKYIAVRAFPPAGDPSTKMMYGYIDDVTIESFNGCVKPLNVEATATDSALTIKWDANGMTKWAVAVSENWAEESLFMRDTVTTSQFTIDTLKPHTEYTYQITTLEGAKKATSDIFTIKTECGPYELIPYKQDFEYQEKSYSDPNPNGPVCWTIPLHVDKSSTSTYYFPYVNSGNPYKGNQKLQFGKHFGTSGSSSDSCYVALPMFNKGINELQLSFFVRGGASGYVEDTLYVGVMSDPENFATFDTVYTFSVTGQVYKEHIVNFSSYAGQGKYIAIYKPVTLHYYFIDDVEVKEIPVCEKVYDVKSKGVSENGATFSWYKKEASKWQFVVAKKNDLSAKNIADHDASIVMDSIIEVNPFVLADNVIEANEQYYVYIRAICGTDNYGEWSAPISLKTVCTARDIKQFATNGDKIESFPANTNACWTFGNRNGGNANIVNNYIQIYNDAKNDGAYAISPKVDIDSIQYLQVTFNAWNKTASYNMREVTVGIISNPEDLATFVPLAVIEGKLEDDAVDHESYTVRFNEYVGDYNEEYGKFIMFISESGDQSNKIELDNIGVDSIPAYLEPLSIVADSIGADAIKIHWENTNADSYEYRYTDKLANIASAPAQPASGVKAELTELAMLKTYYVQVRAKYGDNWSAWSNWRKFATECPAARPIPFAENFDNGSSSTAYKNPPQCWGAFASDGTEGADCLTPTVYNSAKKDGVGGLHIAGSSKVASYTVLPRLDADLSNAILAFDYKQSTYNKPDSLWIGVAINAENVESIEQTVVWVDSLFYNVATSAANTWQQYQKKLEGAGSGQYIVLKCKSNYSSYSTSYHYGFYIDNMSVEPEASCKKPEAPVAVDRALNALGFSWTDTIASNWDVIAVPKGDDAPAMEATPAATVDTTYASVSGLNPATEYDLYVRANCGGGDVSFWVGPVTMKTLAVAKYPYFTNFEKPTETTAAGNASYKVDAGWITGHAKGTGTTYSAYPYVKTNTATTNFSYGNGEATAANALMFAGQTSADSMYVILPVMYDSTAMAEVDLDTVQIRFQARMLTSGLGTKKNQIPFKTPSVTNITGDPSAQWQEVTRRRAIMVGVVSNPLDINTFHMLDSFVLAPVLTSKDTLLTTDDPRDNMWWEEISIPLAGAKGKYIAMLYYGTSSNYFYIDNLYVEKAVGLYAPNNIKGVTASPSSITVTWTNRFNAPKIDIGYVAAGGALSELTIVTTDKDTFEIVGLESNKQYDVYVRANDGNGHVSNWSAGAPLTTAYVVEQAEAYWDFSKTDTYIMPTTGKYAPLGWKFGSKYSTSTSYNPQLQFNAANAAGTALNGNVYSRNEKVRNASLYIQSFVSSSNNSDGAYAIMPLVKGNLDDKELHFWARLCTHNFTSGAIGNASYATAAYPRSIKVGYVSDPDDINTFVLLADIELPAFASTSGNISGDASGNKYWNEIAVPLKGIGEGKHIAFLSEYGKTNAIYLDQIKVQDAGSSCYMPNRLRLDSLGAHAAKFSWELGEGQWAVQLATTKNTAHLIYDTVANLAYRNDTLLSNTAYSFKVKKLCDGGVESQEVGIEFTTDCDLYAQENAVWGFDDQLVDHATGTYTAKAPVCWHVKLGVAANASAYNTYTPKALANTSTVITAHDGNTTSNYSLQFYTNATSYDAFAILPKMDIDREKTTLHFYGRAARFNKTYNSSNKTFLNAINNAYNRLLVVGTMTDPDDPETFVAVDTIRYDHVWPVLKESNLDADSMAAHNDYWQEYTLPLVNYTAGAYIAFKAPQPEAASYFYIDDIAILDAETCTEIGQITVSEITKSSAKLNWTIPQGVEVFYMEVSTDSKFKDADKLVFADTVKALSYDLTALQPATKYYVRVKHVCSELKQSDFKETSLTTLYTIRFAENFKGGTMPDNWRRYNYADIKPATSSTWEIGTGDNMYGPYASSYIMGSWKRWLETPQIDLSDVAAADSIALSFDLATTNKNLAQEDSVFFLVMISTDGGVTWPEENRTVWGTTADCDYPFSAISNAKKGTRWHLDMSKYNGQSIRIMFGTDVTKLQGSTGYIYLDNVQLNYYTASEYGQMVCEWTEYEDDNFSIDANDLKVGQTTKYEKFEQAEKAGEKDKYASMDLTVTPMAKSSLDATLCEGESYMLNGFEIAEPQTGAYRRKLAGAVCCDSVVTLNLIVLNKQYAVVEKTICQGSYYEFNGEKYYTNTIKSDTLYGQASNGCDSIVALYLTVAPILAGETEEVYLCPDSAYYLSEKYPALKDSGLYVDTVKTALGCDSIVSVNIKNVPNEKTIIRAAICPGEVYNEGVFAGLSIPGDYPSAQKTVYGCDSIVTLHLLVATAVEELQAIVIYDSVAVNQLPYVLNGQELLPDSTEQGIYTRPITLNCGEAIAVINVGNAIDEGIHNTFVNSLAIMPNPAAVGQQINVYGSYNNAMIEVIASTGALVYKAQNLNGSIVIPGIPAAGIYLVRLTENGKVYQAKLMVK